MALAVPRDDGGAGKGVNPCKPLTAGAKMTQMENRIVLTRFKDGYGPVGAYFLHLKTYTQNAYWQDYETFWRDSIEKMVGDTELLYRELVEERATGLASATR